MKPVILFLMLLLFPNIVFSATIYGTIYDLSLDKANDVRIEINTEPKQFYISKNGSYAFNVPNGAYSIEAKQLVGNLLIASTSENITIRDDGSYVLDLILFPSLDDDLETDINIIDLEEKRKINLKIVIVIALIFVFAIIAFYIGRKKKKLTKKEEKQEDSDLEQIIKILKQEGGRTTQKEIRKHIPLSEAKISLMIAELEHKGKIEKIKKGRGNILILKKNEEQENRW